MICERSVKYFVREGELEKIENYDKAIADKTQTWHCHHRLELTLDGEFACSMQDLKRMGMYYNRPYFELIFLTKAEHQTIHNQCKPRSSETRKKLSKANRDKPYSDFGKKYFAHFGYSREENIRQYTRENRYYHDHGKKCRWE